jgi:UDP-N-acetylglucosamine diphosphorylase/glucosamine-1-phosphate N-acetyltransferase
MHLVVFEGSLWPTFAPIAINRPAFWLLSGTTTLLEKQIRYMNPSRLTLWIRPELEAWTREVIVPRLKLPVKINEPLDDEPAVLTSARTLHFSRFEQPDQECVIHDDGLVRIAYVKRPGLSLSDVTERNKKWLSILDLPDAPEQGRLAGFTWDLINWNEESLVSDSLTMPVVENGLPKGAYHVIDELNVLVDAEVKIEPGVVIDASRGPVMLDRGAWIGANSVIEGPCYIGEYSQVMPLTSVRRGTTIGPGCKIGGAVSNSIFMGFTSKQFEGYVGDSYIGRWTTLGSGTTTANAKATYGEVSVQIGSSHHKTGRRVMGILMGDHTKTSICTRFVPGAYVGYCSMLVGAGLTPRFVPSFSYWSDSGVTKFNIAKGAEVAQRVHDRRDRQWSSLDDDVHRYASQAAMECEK